ncbi:hypothetical protein DAPPUDRAFT_111110 [Daphnia pulex]|uniref:Uncharacterized protein n=1 Tax=Daphnia pulex TaxID=6669 RepID=E9H852_DAPPU|nr:hypothetical protein DAPPUDRAFT_111110 [Daphnia pulex]|eukprot:EFX72088.1 hypothetical protein DAPPUDRAFT_111110 [Daphnia pulex]
MAEALRDSNLVEDTIPDEIMGTTRLNRHRVRCDYKPDKRAMKSDPSLADVPPCLAESQTREGMRLHRLEHSRYQCDAPSNTFYLSYKDNNSLNRHIKEKHSEHRNINPDEGTILRNVPAKPPSSKVSEMQIKKEELQGKLEGELSLVKRELRDVKGELSDVKGELNEVKVELNEVKGELNVCKGKVFDLQDKIGDIEVSSELSLEEDEEEDEQQQQRQSI